MSFSNMNTRMWLSAVVGLCLAGIGLGLSGCASSGKIVFDKTPAADSTATVGTDATAAKMLTPEDKPTANKSTLQTADFHSTLNSGVEQASFTPPEFGGGAPVEMRASARSIAQAEFPGDCQGSCPNNCPSNSQGACPGDCQDGCRGSCQGSCPGDCPGDCQDAMTFSAAEPRLPPYPGGDGRVAVPSAFEEDYEDECLFDGGDRSEPVHFDEFHRRGLDTEDTVAEYVDDTGELHVKPSNRVCVYSPRFGAVRSVSASESGEAFQKASSTIDANTGVGMENRVATLQHARTEGPEGLRVRSRASGINVDEVQAAFGQSTTVVEHTKLLNAFEDLTFFQTGRFLQSEHAQLAYGIQAAAFWSQSLSPIITAQIAMGQVVESKFRPEETVGVEDNRRKGELRIVKLADRKQAQPGEVVTFTIRYDNLGERELTDIRIIDNLTPRLEYVPDSGTSDRDGELIIEDNQEGSIILKFLVSEPLLGGEGGSVTFQARVR